MTSGPILVFLRLALTISLYLFLFVAFYLLWQELRRQSQLQAARRPKPIFLSHQLSGEAYSMSFEKPEIIIGRDPACDFPLEENTVSARHARLFFRQKHWWIEDLHSKNGTFLNDENISMPIVLSNGDRLHFGQALVNVEINHND